MKNISKNSIVSENYQRNLNIFIPEKFLHLIYKDEINDHFILTKFGELYRESKSFFKLTTWKSASYYDISRNNLIVEREDFEKEGILFDYYKTDDKLYQGIVRIEDIPTILSFGIHKRRPNLNGKWLEDKKQKLAHDIKPIHLKPKCSPAYALNFNQKYLTSIKNRHENERKEKHLNKTIGIKKGKDLSKNKSNQRKQKNVEIFI